MEDELDQPRQCVEAEAPGEGYPKPGRAPSFLRRNGRPENSKEHEQYNDHKECHVERFTDRGQLASSRKDPHQQGVVTPILEFFYQSPPQRLGNDPYRTQYGRSMTNGE